MEKISISHEVWDRLNRWWGKSMIESLKILRNPLGLSLSGTKRFLDMVQGKSMTEVFVLSEDFGGSARVFQVIPHEVLIDLNHDMLHHAECFARFDGKKWERVDPADVFTKAIKKEED